MSDQLDERINALINQIATGAGGGIGREALKAELEVLLAAKYGRLLSGLADAIFSAQRVVGERLDRLNPELEQTRKEFHESSTAATRQTRSLVGSSWTLVLVTLVLGFISYKQFDAAQQAVLVQVAPEVRLEMEDNGDLIVINDGGYPVVDISIDIASTVILGPPHNSPVGQLRHAAQIPDRKIQPWWHLDS